MPANTPENFNPVSTKLESAASIQKIHSVSSNVRQKGKSISKIPSKRRGKLDFDRYLVGRSYQLFKSAVKVPATLEFYRRNLYYFCDSVHKSTEQITEHHGPFKKVKGKNRPNIEGILELQKLIENYALSLQERVDRKEIKPSSCVARMPAVKLFCEMNDIVLNWRKIGKLLPSTDLVAEDEAYTREQIKKMLQFCDLRTRIIVLFLASSGMRLGGLSRFEEDGTFVGLKHGHLKPMYDKEDPAQVIAVHVRVYAGTQDEYDSFVSPEAWYSYTEYLYAREKFGEKITKDSPVLLSRFAKKTLAEGRAKAIDPSTIQNLLAAIRDKAGINERSAHYNERFTIKTVHAFRKFFNTTLKSIKGKDGQPLISFVNKERLLGHTLVEAHALEENYDRSDRVKELLIDYLRALPELTMSDEERQKLTIKKMQDDLSSMKSVSVELEQEKQARKKLENEMQSVIVEEVAKQVRQAFELRQQNAVLENAKPEVLGTLEVKKGKPPAG